MKVLTILLLVVIATPTLAAPKRKRVFNIYTPDEIERIDTPNSGRKLKKEIPVLVGGSSTNMSMPTEPPSTSEPTWSPTIKRTKKPKSTWAPTTIKPTWSPTSSSPTDNPTTTSPTDSPTMKPTKRPKATWRPTTAEPTYSPSSSEPTESPSVITSSPKTATPTESPTETASRKQATALEGTNAPTLPPSSVLAEEAETEAPSSAPVGEMGPTDADTTTTPPSAGGTMDSLETFSTIPPSDAAVTPSPVSPAPITPVPVSPAPVSPAPVSLEPTDGFPTMSPVEADKPASEVSAVEQAIQGIPNGATTLGMTLAAMSVACIIVFV